MAAADLHQPRWAAHPWRARGLRLLVYALPIACSLAFVRLVTSVTGVPTGSLWIFLLWWLAMSLTATAVVSLVFTLSRRLLPLGALLTLSLVFPDESPSRFRLALRSGTVESLEKRLRQMREANEPATAQEAAEILLQLVSALDTHDRVTRGHAERVRAYSYSLGRQLGLAPDDLDRLNWAALLHDVGKLSISTEILNKPDKPTDEEWTQLRLHPLYGETLVEPLQEWLGAWTGAVGYHHEHWDGRGYPRGVAGEEIPLAGRIVAIADVYDVITSARSYKQPSSPTEARAELTRCAGTQFDPRLVRAFVSISLGRMRLVLGPLSWLSNAPLLARIPSDPGPRHGARRGRGHRDRGGDGCRGPTQHRAGRARAPRRHAAGAADGRIDAGASGAEAGGETDTPHDRRRARSEDGWRRPERQTPGTRPDATRRDRPIRRRRLTTPGQPEATPTPPDSANGIRAQTAVSTNRATDHPTSHCAHVADAQLAIANRPADTCPSAP